ncbi:MAG: PadR family transcriptional regulator [Candidatus Aenigmatarchaeota archaeon]|nr:MAG: PadR family transcriptional regulator [Candidatus Aenigmarchaeota archaeon]
MQRPHERLKRKIEKENLWLFILSVLERNNNLTGAEIKQRLLEDFSLRIGTVTSYKVLYLLERGGYVKKERNKKTYSITIEGKKELKRGTSLLGEYNRILKHRIKVKRT